AVQIASFRFRKGMAEGFEFIFSPIVIILIIITIISVIVGLRQSKSIMAEGDVQSGSKRAPFIFTGAILAYLLIAVTDASLIGKSQAADKVFPMFVGIVSIVAVVILMIQMMRRPETDVVFADKESSGDDREAPHGLWETLAWFVGLLILTSLVGFIIALAVFLIAFFRIRAGEGWTRALLLSAAGIGFICLMAWVLNRDFPPGVLQQSFTLPWPLT
ncbi:MAG: tripartite tricarboxylate transporter TctB family protein, partial [Pseudomonadota bacterium]